LLRELFHWPKSAQYLRKMTCKSGNLELDQCIQNWLAWDENEKTLDEIKNLVEQKNWPELETRLIGRLAFGTAGLRGRMQAGFNFMNDLVVIQTAQGIAKYLLATNKTVRDQGIVLGYDGRYNSKRFADLSAAVFLNEKIKVYLFSRMVPTPFVSFCVKVKKAAAGVMVTASHNPKEDNGYKVYWGNSAQIISPHDKNIQKSILENLEPLPSSWVVPSSNQVIDTFDEISKSYYENLHAVVPKEFLSMNQKTKCRYVYSAMHGVGYPFVAEAFKVANLPELIPVEEQKDANPDFPTVKFPNPEEGKSSLELSIKLANEKNLTIILANDPDADRLACAEKDPATGAWKVFSGNELGSLFGWWILQCQKATNTKLDNCYMLASTVSSKILRAIAKKEGFHFEETLTGFKWMGNRSIELEAQGKKVLFAFEEAIGFMVFTNVLDKDGVSAAVHLATLINYLHERSLNLSQKLNDIYKEYGFHCTMVSYFLCYDPVKTKKIFDRIRTLDPKNGYPTSVKNGQYPIKYVRDLTTGVDTSEPDGKSKLPTSKSSQMITFTFENGIVLTLRTSGTEPKIKYYGEMCAQPSESNWDELKVTLKDLIKHVCEELLQPEQNGLIAKSD